MQLPEEVTKRSHLKRNSLGIKWNRKFLDTCFENFGQPHEVVVGGAVASWLVRPTSERAVRV